MHKEESHWESPEAAQVKELEEEIEKFRQEKEDLEITIPLDGNETTWTLGN